MRIQGEIVRKRLYNKNGNLNNYLLFLRIHDGVMVNGLRIHYIPALTSNKMNFSLGQQVDIKGKIKFQRLITPSGTLSFSPIPVMISSDSGV
ncbi:hypothetical protein PH210_12095 [Paenibacillus sp. BSR1-1]|uniref:hypothetical protein n=1 Tax=Paenibacillus sp. BSR1-1 TaxID=3020845 RepID=UPI0025B1B6D4|nr:hypothetical protein [Paenibacillus sp. BSR1-1]MDN3016938.1 hypothetical protein [Paenibacillus sp. BSR1-1]